ncbi:hypothetical protein CEXT_518301 [Caerostris extrusa]|uniref:Uncharacterized protein n=1 Tax=Caerostris extrusa TaxID=172846 RepID=A0AAV4TXM4_CAEEX|nr:hypothetical protein CEXT_518301 [Caerostris extrusa]
MQISKLCFKDECVKRPYRTMDDPVCHHVIFRVKVCHISTLERTFSSTNPSHQSIEMWSTGRKSSLTTLHHFFHCSRSDEIQVLKGSIILGMLAI